MTFNMTLKARGKDDLIPGKNNRKITFHENIVAMRKLEEE